MNRDRESAPHPRREPRPPWGIKPVREYPPPMDEHDLEATYDCPDCGYYQSGATTSPYDYQDHLTEEHGYTDSEARRIRHGRPYEYGIDGDSYGRGELP